MRRTCPLPLAVALSAAVSLLLAGCSGEGAASGSSDAPGGAVRIVASTNVYGDLAETIGGDLVDVTSIIDSPDKDPHEYEADARTQLHLSKAQLVIENGGGYDDFVETMLSASENTGAIVITATEVSGLDQAPSEGEFNEHVWYDLPTVTAVVDEIATRLGEIDTANSSIYTANAASLTADIADLEAKTETLKTVNAGTGVAVTEPVPLYLLGAIGLIDHTPHAFSEAIEEGSDVAPGVLDEMLGLLTGRRVSLLVYNAQAVGAQTDAVLAAAKKAGVPVVPVTETLPADSDYVSWMTANLDALSAALSK